MTKTNYRLRKCILTFMCATALLFNGCAPTIMCATVLLINGCTSSMPISSNVEKEEDKPKAAEPSVVKDEFTTDKPVTKQDTPIFNARKSENKLSVVWNKDHLSEGSSIDEEKVAGHEGLKVLKKVEILEARLRGEEEEREKTAILVKELNEKLTALQAAEAAAAAKPGAGYLADGSTIGVGIVDGDDELRVLKKVKRLEARLSDEHEKIELLKKELTDLKSAKIIVENELANNKKLMQETSNDLLEKISALESTLKETESRAIAAEEALHPIKKELLKVQISETKAQQELYKLKIKKLQEEEE